MGNESLYDVIIIGGGQSGLATAYHLRKTGLNYLILDKENSPGGSWQHYWNSLRLFSPAQWSSLPGVLMPGGTDYYPTKDEVIEYLEKYEKRYQFPVRRGIEVHNTEKQDHGFQLKTSAATFRCKALISATGSFSHPVIPKIPGLSDFNGEIIHSAEYKDPEAFKEKKIAIIGEGNSGAQILAELSQYAPTWWFTSKPPNFLPDHIDGRYLFDAATQLYEARKRGKVAQPPSLGDIVMVDSVKEARDRQVFEHFAVIERFLEKGILTTGKEEISIDIAIFCTGFAPALDHLKDLPLNITRNRTATKGTRSTELPGLWLVGYGGWTGFASATLIGVGRSARQTVSEVQKYLEGIS